MNEGCDQVARSLKALARYPALRPIDIAQFAQLQSSAISNELALLDVMAAIEIGPWAGCPERRTTLRDEMQEQDLNKPDRGGQTTK